MADLGNKNAVPMPKAEYDRVRQRAIDDDAASKASAKLAA